MFIFICFQHLFSITCILFSAFIREGGFLCPRTEFVSFVRKNLSQLQFSIELEVTQETISAYEHSKHLPSVTALMKMSQLFGVSMDYIMGLSYALGLLDSESR